MEEIWQFQIAASFPDPISKCSLMIPLSISEKMPELTLTDTFSPTNSNENFCMFRAVGASNAAFTPLMNH